MCQKETFMLNFHLQTEKKVKVSHYTLARTDKDGNILEEIEIKDENSIKIIEDAKFNVK